MKRRFQLAKALVHDPEILILDEPTAGVDVELRRDLWEYLKDLHAKGKTILLTTHYIEEAELLCENIGIINDGKILKEGSPKSLIEELGTAGVTVYLSTNDVNVESFFKNFKFTKDNNRLHFSVKNPESSIPIIINKLVKENISIQSIESQISSLEDVFLNLTGKGLHE